MKKNIQFSHYDVKVRGDGGWKLTTEFHARTDTGQIIPLRHIAEAKRQYKGQRVKFVPRYLTSA